MLPMNKLFLLVCAVLASLLLVGCWFVGDVEKVYGRYVYEDEAGRFEIELKRDMSYVETIQYAGKTSVKTGKWIWIVSRDGEGLVSFSDFVVVDIKGKDFCRYTSMGVERWFGRTVLVAGADPEIHFVRQRD